MDQLSRNGVKMLRAIRAACTDAAEPVSVWPHLSDRTPAMAGTDRLMALIELEESGIVDVDWVLDEALVEIGLPSKTAFYSIADDARTEALAGPAAQLDFDRARPSGLAA
jgi:hypothetical protein